MSGTPLETRVDSWLAAYCQPDPTRRLEAIRGAWNEHGHLADPPFEARGHQGIADAGGTLLAQFPGHAFERTTALDAHHNFLRYGWRLLNHEGVAVMEGVDMVELDVDGRLMRVVGFFGAQPPAR
ncbi:MAG: hypothetical protein ABIT82_04330 [Ramlibacter sp.]